MLLPSSFRFCSFFPPLASLYSVWLLREFFLDCLYTPFPHLFFFTHAHQASFSPLSVLAPCSVTPNPVSQNILFLMTSPFSYVVILSCLLSSCILSGFLERLWKDGLFFSGCLVYVSLPLPVMSIRPVLFSPCSCPPLRFFVLFWRFTAFSIFSLLFFSFSFLFSFFLFVAVSRDHIFCYTFCFLPRSLSHISFL